MKRSKDISLFKIALFLCIALYFGDHLIAAVFFVLLLIDNRKDAFLFLVLYVFLFFLNSLRYDLIPIGIAEERRNGYVIVDKLFYKSIVFDDGIFEGDILYFDVPGKLNDTASQIRKNILFKTDDFIKIGTFSLRRWIMVRIESYPPLLKDILLKMIFNRYPESETSIELGYGLSAYYFFRKVSKRSKKLCFLLIFLFSVVFSFPIRFYLLIPDLFLSLFELRKDERFAIKLILIMTLNYELLKNPSFLLPFLFDLYSIFSLDISFKTYLALLSAELFGEFDLFDVFFFDISRNFKIFLFLICILNIFFPFLSTSVLFFGKMLSFIQKIDIPIRGELDLIWLIVFISLCRHAFMDTRWKKFLLLIFLILFPLRDPFLQVGFIDVGQGDSAYIKMPFSRSCILIDTGSPYNYYKLKRFLLKKGIYQIDELIITHNDSDHNGNIEALKEDFKVKEVIERGRDLEYHGLFFDHLDAGVYDNDNDNSLVYLLDVQGLSFLFTGDISAKVERKLADTYDLKGIDVLKASHHGSKTGTSEYFVSKLLPRFCILSTSGQYGHPHKEVLDVLDRYKAEIYSTNLSSSIVFFPGRLFSFITTGKCEFVIIRS